MKVTTEQEGSQDGLKEIRENQKLVPLFEEVAWCLDEKIRTGETHRFQRQVDQECFRIQVSGLHRHASVLLDALVDREWGKGSRSFGWNYVLVGTRDTMPLDRLGQKTSVIAISKAWGNRDYRYLLRARTVKMDFWRILDGPMEPKAGEPAKNPWLEEALVGVLGWDDPLPRLVWKKGASLTERYLLALIKDIPDWKPIKEKNS